MIFVFIILWVIAAIIYFNDPKRLKWAALTAFSGGFGAFGRVVKDLLIPHLEQEYLLQENLYVFLNWVYVTGSFINILGLPYFFLLFSLSYNQVFDKNKFNRVKIIFLLPIIFMLINSTPFYPVPNYNYKIMITWVVPYIIVSFYFFLINFLKEKNPVIKQSKAFTIILILPVFFQLFHVYIARVFDIYETYKLNVYSIALFFLCFIYFLIRYDVAGIKLKFEKKQLDHSLKVMESGSKIVTHNLKNQILKINLCAYNLKNDLIKKTEEIPDELIIIESSSEHLIEMMKRYQEKTEEFYLEPEYCKINDLFNEVLLLMQPSITLKNIKILNKVQTNRRLLCDSYHVKEVLVNIINNAIEAMKDQGIIQLEVSEGKKYLTITISDNGEGIPENMLKNIYNPFFSTKKSNFNFGLGLTYCHQVMKKHKGNINISSEKGEGTTVNLSFPLNHIKI